MGEEGVGLGAGVQAHMSLQAPLKAAHQGSESSVGVTGAPVHLWGKEGQRAGSGQRPGHIYTHPLSQADAHSGYRPSFRS